MVARNAARKADWVAALHPDAWVLGADTTVCIDGHALNKPADLAWRESDSETYPVKTKRRTS
jgi:septum formation protein